MSLVKAIEKQFKQRSNCAEAVEDTLLKDSVLDHTVINDEFEKVGPGETRKKVGIGVDGKYQGRPVSRKKVSVDNLGNTEFQKTLNLLIDDESSDLPIREPVSFSSGEGSESEASSGEKDEGLSESVTDESGIDEDENQSEHSGDETDSGTLNDYSDEGGLADYVDDSPTGPSDPVKLFSKSAANVAGDVSKGNSIKTQLSIWDNLLECRIKLQPCLVAVNKLYQTKDFVRFTSELSPTDKDVVSKTHGHLTELTAKLLELQECLSNATPDYSNLKGTVSDESEIEDENEDVEMEPAKKKRKSENFLDEIYLNFKPFSDSVIQKWCDKVSIFRKKNSDFSAFDQPMLKQIDQILLDKSRLVKKTQLMRSEYNILKYQSEECGNSNVMKTEEKKNEYNVEIFDDSDFYHKLLRDFIEHKNVNDPSKHARQWTEFQKMRSQMKRKVDTKASKGRKLRFTVHNKLVNFMAPVSCSQWVEEAETKLFNSLFGKTLQT